MTIIPDFTSIPLGSVAPEQSSREAWLQNVGGTAADQLTWHTPEQLDVQALYSADDLEGLEHLETMPGLPPFVRGPYATMYVQRPWTVRQYAGFYSERI